MSKLTIYLLRQLVVGLVLITVVLTALVWLSQSLRFIEEIVVKGLSPTVFLYFTSLMLPDFLSVILPIALLVSSVFVYNRMVNDRELVAMVNIGLSPISLSRPGLVLGLAVTLLGYGLSFFVVPITYREFKEFQWQMRYAYSHVLLQEETFNDVSDDVSVYVRERRRGGELAGILVHDARDAESPVIMTADRGVLTALGNRPQVILYNGNRQVVDLGKKIMSSLDFDRYVFTLEGSDDVLPERYPEARELMLDDLTKAMDNPDYPPQWQRKYQIELHKRLVSPLHGLILPLIAMAILLTGQFNRRGQGRRIVLLTAAAIGFVGTHLATINMAIGQPALAPLLYLVNLLPALAAWIHLADIRPRWSRPVGRST